MRRLENKIALVTGARAGIGRGVADRLAREGATVIYTARTHHELDQAAASTGGLALPLDVTSATQWQEVVAEVDRRFGRLDIMVNNAGLVRVRPVETIPIDEWREVSAANLEGVLIGTQAALPLLRAGGRLNVNGSAVVNICSLSAILVVPGQASYNAAKAGLSHLSRCMAIEWARARYNIRVNSIMPGAIATPMLKTSLQGWPDDEDVLAPLAAQIPLGFVGGVEDIASGAAYLASDEARYITATELVIDGGLSKSV
jgi:3(or 17)beta-hydroxysteroid dehydrogenase